MSDLDAVLGFEAGVESERAAIVAWIARYGDEINRVIARTPDGPIKTNMMGEFCATVSIRHAIERGDHHNGRKEG